MICAHGSIKGLPGYLSKTLPIYFANIDDCVAPVIPFGFESETIEVKDRKTRETGSLDHHCKTSKMRHLQKLVESIRVRTEAWLEYVKENPSVKGLQALFTPEEIQSATPYVPRCK